MKEKATKEEMYQEALDRLEILVSYGVDKRIIEHFERGILWAYTRCDDCGHIHGLYPASPSDAMRMRQVDEGSNGVFLTYCVCYLVSGESKAFPPKPCQITVGNDKTKWLEEREYLLTTCLCMEIDDDEVIEEGMDAAMSFYEMMEDLGCPVIIPPAA